MPLLNQEIFLCGLSRDFTKANLEVLELSFLQLFKNRSPKWSRLSRVPTCPNIVAPFIFSPFLHVFPSQHGRIGPLKPFLVFLAMIGGQDVLFCQIWRLNFGLRVATLLPSSLTPLRAFSFPVILKRKDSLLEESCWFQIAVLVPVRRELAPSRPLHRLEGHLVFLVPFHGLQLAFFYQILGLQLLVLELMCGGLFWFLNDLISPLVKLFLIKGRMGHRLLVFIWGKDLLILMNFGLKFGKILLQTLVAFYLVNGYLFINFG